MATLLSNLGPRARKVLRYLGFIVLGIVTFVFAFQLSFPFDRVKDKVIEALSEKYDVTIGDVERGIVPGRMYFKAMSLRTRPTRPGDFVTTFYMEQLEVDLGLFALLRGAVAVKLDAKIGAGHIKGNVALSKDGTVIDVVGEDLPSASLPTREALGLPMSGKVRFAFNLDLPNEKSKSGKVSPAWNKAEGGAELACPSGCTVGDGKTKLKMNLKNMRNQAFAEGGIDFGKVNIDTLLARVEIKNGKLTVTKFDTKSADGELHVAFEMAFNQQDINQSLVTGCLRFNGSASLLKREPKTHAAISATGAPLGPDNLFHIKLDGPLRDVRRLGQVCGAAANTSIDNPGGTTARPNLTITPEVPSRPGSAAPVVPAPQVTPPPAPAAPQDAGVADALHAPPAEGEVPATGSASPPTGAALPPSGPPGSAAPQ
ncbi:MAG TPA: type II secretion system protein GspN [Kofleriaceae bacterium]|nr:type II secretion system protein GspN [Kofleriaceae bacterium]